MNIEDFSKSRYTHRDFSTLKQDLVDLIPSLTEKWTSREESDPGMVLVTLMSILGDNLSYNADKMALEHYLDSVTQRKNCSQILKLLGYKMRGYSAAKTTVNISSSNGESFVINTYETSLLSNNGISYIITNKHNEENIPGESNSYTVSSSPISFDAIEGSIQSISFSKNSVIDNKIYFQNLFNVDNKHIWILDNHGKLIGNLVDDLRLIDDNYGIYFEFKTDEYDNNYLELSDGWQTLVNNSDAFTLNFISCSGEDGNVSNNAFTQLVSPSVSNVYITNYSNTSESIYGTSGKNPETIEEAKKESAKYNFTLDSFVTSEDFEKGCLQVSGINLAKLIDNTILDLEELNIEDIINRDDFQEYIGSETSLLPYLIILYLIYGELSENKYVSELSYIEDSEIHGRIDYLDYRNFNKPNPEGTSGPYYPYKPSDIVLQTVSEHLRSKRCILTKDLYGTVKTYPFTVSGTVYLLEPQSPESTLSIAKIIDSSLKTLFDPNNLGFGNKPNFIKTVDAIQNSDTRIKYFDTGFNSRFINFYNSSLNGFDSTSLAVYAGLSWKANPVNPVERNIFPVPFVFNDESMKFKISWHLLPTEYDSLSLPTGSGTTIRVPDQFINNPKYDSIDLETEFNDNESRIVKLKSLAELNTLVWYLNNSNGVWTYDGR